MDFQTKTILHTPYFLYFSSLYLQTFQAFDANLLYYYYQLENQEPMRAESSFIKIIQSLQISFDYTESH
jgi:hypothetical protein